MFRLLTIIAALAFITFPSFSQNGYSVSGIVKDDMGELVPFAIVRISGGEIESKAVKADVDGNYKIEGLPKGAYTVTIESYGFQDYVKNVELSSKNPNPKIDVKLEGSVKTLKEAVVTAKSDEEKINESGYSVNAVSTEEYANVNEDVNEVLKQIPGVNIRESGGVGSSYNISLNGLSGNKVRVFLDGVPMENTGTSLGLNNIPVNMIDRIEVYKGVVPIYLASDALAGAVNMVSAHKQSSYLDASYSVGSFNTHRASVNGQFVTDKDILIGANTYFIYSDNDYRMDDVKVVDSLGNIKEQSNVKRFNDEYISGMVSGKVGVINKKYADELSISYLYSKNRDQRLHPDNNILKSFGEFQTQNTSQLTTMVYRKNFDKLSIQSYAQYGNIYTAVIDTSRRRYNWLGESIEREENDPKGEVYTRRSFFEQYDKTIKASLGLGYTLTKNHKISANYSLNNLERQGEDKVDEYNYSFKDPSKVNKSILGTAYTLTTNNEKFVTDVFAKYYMYNASIISYDDSGNSNEETSDINSLGYGIASTYHITKDLQVKTSYERGYRYPEGTEVLGDGIYVLTNSNLKPESSDNINFGARYYTSFSSWNLLLDANYFFRNSRDFIRFNATGPFGEYENLNSVRSQGIEFGYKLQYKRKLTFSGNLTYQNLTDQTEFDEGLVNTHYKSRIPNIPYLLGNVRVAYTFYENKKIGRFSANWVSRYVNEYFLFWASLGDKDSKNIIPTQFVNDFQISYSSTNKRYNVSFVVSNAFDKKVYDNFRIQKPGRAFTVKLRYFLKPNS